MSRRDWRKAAHSAHMRQAARDAERNTAGIPAAGSWAHDLTTEICLKRNAKLAARRAS